MGVVVINLGATTTSLAVFEEGDILHTAILSIGSEYISKDIALGLRISIDTAEKIKVREGSCLVKEFKKQDEVNYADFGGSEDGGFSKKEVAEIIEARVEEIMEKVDKELKRIGRSSMLPAGAVLTGGGAKLEGIVEIAKKTLRLPASLGYPQELISSLDKISDLSFSTAVGLVLWGMEMQNKSVGGGFPLPNFGKFGSINKTVGQIKNILKSLLP